MEKRTRKGHTMSEENTKSTPVSDKKPRTRYEILVGLSYKNKRVEPGDVVTDIPKQSVTWLLDRNYIKEVS